MKRLLLIGLAACAFALAPNLPAAAMPVATPDAIGVSDGVHIEVKGGKHKHKHWKHHGGRGHHYGWHKKRHHHHGWRHRHHRW